MSPTPTIAHCDMLPELFQQLLRGDSNTHLIICATRSEFMVHLAAAIRSQRAISDTATSHDLLTKTIGLLARSSKIRLSFCPTLESLRAYLAALGATSQGATNEEQDSHNRPLLSIVDMIAMHATTSEFSAQGLSRTLASAVETAKWAGMDLRLYECMNALDPSSDVWGSKLWETNVPLLNGSVRMRGDDSNWGGRGVTVKRVAERWFELDPNH